MATLAFAEVNLQRCRVTSPFTGRIKTASVEIGQFVSPGQPLVTLADDTLLEIQVPLDAGDARQWLQFERKPSENPTAWFSKPSRPRHGEPRHPSDPQASTVVNISPKSAGCSIRVSGRWSAGVLWRAGFALRVANRQLIPLKHHPVPGLQSAGRHHAHLHLPVEAEQLEHLGRYGLLL